VVLIAGLHTYGPNVHGTTWFATSVLPRLRQMHPDVELRIVGESSARIQSLARLEGVVVVGEVGDMRPALADAWLVAVPVRWGSGSRVKILEAWAHGLPVVSTALGAEGIGAVDGENLLIADGEEEFARKCADLLSDRDRARRLGAAGRSRYLRHFTVERFQRQVCELAFGSGRR
jgi:glycosyltransferase involved in cell wall biosynthesis